MFQFTSKRGESVFYQVLRMALLGISVVFFATSCVEGLLRQSGLDPVVSANSNGGSFGVWDGAHGGIDGFYFLPPLVTEPSYDGEFDSGLSPVVEICNGTDCTSILTSFTLGNSSGSIRVDPIAEHYIVNWDVGQFGVVAGSNYRIRVRVGDFVLGYADVFVVKNASQSVGEDLIKVVLNRTVPVKFRIEKGIAASITIDPTEATIDEGDEQQFTAKVFDLSGNEISGLPIVWSSLDEAVATVDQEGLAKGESAGETTISATYQYLNAQAKLTVEDTDAPPPGRDIVVFNDVNVFTDEVYDLNANNILLLKNLINFSTTGTRNSGTKVAFDCGRDSRFPNACSGGLSRMVQIISEEGFTVTNLSSSSGTLVNIDPEIKTLILWLPQVAYTVEEVNALKLFAEEGGRLIFVGEWDGYYGPTGIAVENQLLINLGAQLRNVGNAVDCEYTLVPGTSLRPNQITTGLTDITVACASVIVPGPNDFPLFFDTTNTLLLAGVAAIDTNPISELQNARVVEVNVNQRISRPMTTSGSDH